MAGAGAVIILVFMVVALAIWSLILFTFFAHYFLVTLTDSSSGTAEVYYPREGFINWWWKPVLCFWVFAFWALPTTLVLAPLAIFSPSAYLIVWGLVLLLVYPMSLASVLYSQHWLIFMHRGVFGRMLAHVRAFAYVHLMTVALIAACVALSLAAMTDVVWMFVAAILVPAAILLYARHWGRFAWLALNYVPGQQKRARVDKGSGSKTQAAWPEDGWAAPEVQKTEAPADGIRAGAPPGHSGAIQADTSPDPHAGKTNAPHAPPAEEYDEWTDTRPYDVIDDPSLPSFPKPEVAAPAPKPAPAAPVFTEEEDEWAPVKKPYGVSDEGAPVEAAPVEATAEKTDADKPLALTQFYAKKAQKEAAEKRQAEEALRTMPKRSKKTPTFQTAFLAGVWPFLFKPGTMVAWANLAVFLFVEYVLLYLLVSIMAGIPKG